ncbi:hypothetical protein AUJ16_04290 [Candidatus Micrarchaeota archaeon CG1_02_60_51]|nr:MAG: hypothetical protein AUJ16_04290 [Candidatus Micrarchaeota archaeon CG1_02_60_51]
MVSFMNVLVVGAGSMGGHHVRVYSEMPEVERVVVADPSPDAAKKFKENPKVVCYDSIKEALYKEEVVGASVAVPTALHYQVGEEFVERGIPTLMEKPLCDSLKDGAKLIALAKKRNVLLMTGHLERFNPAIQALKENLKMLGKPVYASTHRYGIPSFRKLGDALYDLAVHDVDLLSFLTGERPTFVSAIERRVLEKDSNDLCAALFEFDGFTASVEANRVAPIKIREMTFVGTEGVARVDYTAQELSILRLSEIPKEYHEYKTFNELVSRAGRGNELRMFIRKDEPLRIELRHFLDCCRGKAQPQVTAIDGLYAVAAAEAASKAAKSGKREKVVV